MFGKLLINCCLSLKKLKRKFFFYTTTITHNYACFTVCYIVCYDIFLSKFVLCAQHFEYTITYDVWLWPSPYYMGVSMSMWSIVWLLFEFNGMNIMNIPPRADKKHSQKYKTKKKEKKENDKYKKKIFLFMSVIGTAFGYWYADFNLKFCIHNTVNFYKNSQ